MKRIRIFVFGMAFLLLFSYISKVLTSTWTESGETDYYQQIAGFYKEPAASLDAVYIGASHVYAFFEAPVAWKNQGITVFPFSSGSQPLAAVPFLIQEIKKTQPQALIILNINELTGPPSSTEIHFLTDHMPFSCNKADMLCYLREMTRKMLLSISFLSCVFTEDGAICKSGISIMRLMD